MFLFKTSKQAETLFSVFFTSLFFGLVSESVNFIGLLKCFETLPNLLNPFFFEELDSRNSFLSIWSCVGGVIAWMHP